MSNMLKALNVVQIYHPYWKWECFKAGFYAPKPLNLNGELAYYNHLKNLDSFESGIDLVFKRWKYSTEHFLTNGFINRIAWLGQASCCIKHSIPSVYRRGFFLLSEQQQVIANSYSEYRIYNFLRENYAI